MLKSIRGKMVLGYLLLAVLIFSVSILSVNMIDRLTGSINKILAENYRSVTAAERMIMALEKQESSILLFLHQQDPSWIRDFHSAQSEFTKWLGRAEDNVTLAGEDEIVDEIDSGYQQFLLGFGDLRSALGDDQATPQHVDLYLENVRPVFLDLEQQLEELLRINHESMLQARERSDEVGAWASTTTITAGMLALLVAAGASFYISKLIIKPTEELTELLRSIKPGNVGHLEAAENPDELGELAKAINEMIARLRRYDEQVISRLQAEKRRSRAIVESIADGLVVVDEELNVQAVNQTARNLFGLLPGDVDGGHLLESIQDERLFEAITDCMESAEMIELRRTKNKWVGGSSDSKRYYELAVSPIIKDDGDIAGAVANFRDVTHYHEVEELKTDIISTITHEFKTPLTSLSMNVSLLSEELQSADLTPSDSEISEIVPELESDLHRLTNLVNNVLDISKLESEAMTIDRQHARVEDIVTQAVDPFHRQAEEAGVDLNVQIAEDTPDVYVDPNKIAWVISNLVGNSLRHTQQGDSIQIAANKRGTRVAISVTDTGTGIPEDMQERIFDKFVQASDSSPGGVGLGLAICREVLEAHGEQIWVDSELGKGSSFTFTLPKAS